MQKTLALLSADELIERARFCVQEEAKATLGVLHCLLEIEDRKLYLERGFPSLYDFAIQELAYSEAAAYRRIQSMRLMREFPDVEVKIRDGNLSLSNAAQLHTFIRSQEKGREVPFDEKWALVQMAQNKSSRDFKKELVKRDPEFVIKETLRSINELEFELKIVIDAELKEKLDHLKNLRSHVNPRMPYRELVRDLSDLGLKKWDPLGFEGRPQRPKGRSGENEIRKGTVRKQSRMQKDSLADSRYVPAGMKRAIWLRDQGCCSFIDPRTKRRCGSKSLLQVDHVQPFSLGGKSQLDNLRLLCALHNQHRAAQTFGPRPS